MYKTMYIIECLDSEYNISNIINNNEEDVIFFEKEKIITISHNYMEQIKQKIILLQLMVENIVNELEIVDRNIEQLSKYYEEINKKNLEPISILLKIKENIN
jgi:hypothetical protein